MKYHNNVKTVLIALSVTLLFFVFSFFILFTLNMTSPTLIVTDRLISSFSEVDSDFSFKFDSVERNFRDRVMIRNLSLYYRDSEIASFEYAEVKLGLFDIIAYFLNLDGTAEVSFNNGDVTISSSLFETSREDESGDQGETTLPSFLKSHNLILTFNDISLSTDYGNGKIDELSLKYIGKDEKLLGDITIPSAAVEYGGYNVNLENLVLSFSLGETVFIKAGIDETSLKAGEITAGLGRIDLSLTSQDIENIIKGSVKAYLSLNEASFSYEEISAQSEKGEIFFSDGVMDVELSSLSGKAGDYTFTVPSLTGELESYDFYTLDLDSVVLGGGDVYGDIEKLNAFGSLSDSELSLSAGFVKTDILKNYTSSLFGITTLSSLSGTVIYDDGIDLTLRFESTIETPSDKINDISFSFNSSIEVLDGKIMDAHVDMRNIYLGYGEKFNSFFIINGNLEEAEISLDYGAFALDVDASLNNKTVKGDFSIENLLVDDILPLFGGESVTLFSDSSTFSLDSSFDFDFNDSIHGSIDYLMDISEIDIGEIKTTLSSSGRLIFRDESVDIENVKLSSSFFNSTFNGSWDKEKNLPSLEFTSTLTGGDDLLNGYIKLGEDRSYRFYGDIAYFDHTYLTGSVDFNTDNIVSSSALLITGNSTRPFTLLTDLEKKEVHLSSESLTLDVDYSDRVEVDIKADNLKTLTRAENGSITVNGNLHFTYDTKDGFNISSDSISVENIYLIPSSPSVSFSLSGNNDRITFSSLLVSDKRGIAYSGKADIDFVLNAVTAALDQKNGEGSVVFSLYKEDEYVSALNAERINLSSFGLDDMYASISLFGRAKELEDFSFDGQLTVTSPLNDNEKINAGLTINTTSITVEDIVFSSSDMIVEAGRLYFDASTGSFGLEEGLFELPNEKPDRAYPISASFSLRGTTDPSSSLISSLSSIIGKKGSGTDISLVLDYIDADNSSFRAEDLSVELKIEDGSYVFTGSFLSGEIERKTGRGKILVDIPSFAGGTFDLFFSSGLLINADVDYFNMGLVNLFMIYPTLVFRDDMVGGEVSVAYKDGAWSLNGSLYADEVACDVFWLEDETLIFHNPRFIIWDNELKSSFTYCTVLDKTTKERKMVRMIVALDMNESLTLESWMVDVYIDEDNPVRVRIPLTAANIDIEGYATGHYYAYTDDGTMYNEGEINVSNAVLSIGMNPYPAWYDQLKGSSSVDLVFHFDNNNQIVYPAGDDPILSIMLQENSSAGMKMDSSGIKCTGNIQIRGGEIYYFQKYFYITSGSISFDDPNVFNPRLSLRATLRDYNTSTGKVEIYLVMKDNTFDNFSPTLESSPAMELSEIMEILGQSILPQSAYGSVSATSVASLVTESFDILSRLGIMTTATNPLSSLSSSLKKVFGVDSFSLHSNILNNIVADTISQATQSGVGSFSPMARFLNGTTLNAGKYLSQNLYLQVMVHLEATSDRSSYTIISDDLALDTELSLEWANSTFNIIFFTRPSYFSFYSLFDTFGFTITKTITF